jgi:phage shock protein A
LARAIAEMRAPLIEAKKQVAVAIGDEKRLKKQCEEQAAHAADWERRALLAVDAGDEALAREALRRQKEAEELGARLESTWQAQKDAVDKLKEHLRALNDQLEACKHDHYQLAAQEHVDAAREAIRSTLRSLQDTSLFSDFEGLVGAAKVDRIRREIEAAREDLGAAIARGERLAAQLDALLREAAARGQ